MPKGKYKRRFNEIEKICLVCKTKLVAHFYNQKYCSIKCQREFHENKPERRKYKIEYMKKYNKTRKLKNKLWKIKRAYGEGAIKAFNRDNRTCQKCGEKNILKLVIHHIDWNEENNNEENILTLCHSCHRYIHINIPAQYFKNKGIEFIIKQTRSWLKYAIIR